MNLAPLGAPLIQKADSNLLGALPPPQPLPAGTAVGLLEEDEGDFELRQQVAEALLGEICWDSPSLGHAECPGASKHTTEGGGPARIHIDGAANVHCFHQSCSAVVEEFNRELRRKIWQAEAGGPIGTHTVMTPAILARQAKRREVDALRPMWEQWFMGVVSAPLNPHDLFRNSPTDLNDRTTDDRFDLLRLFHPADLIWTGEVHQSTARNFAEAGNLIRERRVRTHFVSTATFKPGTTRRTKENVLHRRFMVVESDELSLPQQAALLWALRTEWQLAAVVYSGGKSLHGWFRWQDAWNTQEAQLELKARLETYHCDTAGLKASQPFRLPGVLRPDTLKMQSLIYLNLNHSHERR